LSASLPDSLALAVAAGSVDLAGSSQSTRSLPSPGRAGGHLVGAPISF
jgi:hypothetical protein